MKAVNLQKKDYSDYKLHKIHHPCPYRPVMSPRASAPKSGDIWKTPQSLRPAVLLTTANAILWAWPKVPQTQKPMSTEEPLNKRCFLLWIHALACQLYIPNTPESRLKRLGVAMLLALLTSGRLCQSVPRRVVPSSLGPPGELNQSASVPVAARSCQKDSPRLQQAAKRLGQTAKPFQCGKGYTSGGFQGFRVSGFYISCLSWFCSPGKPGFWSGMPFLMGSQETLVQKAQPLWYKHLF